MHWSHAHSCTHACIASSCLGSENPRSISRSLGKAEWIIGVLVLCTRAGNSLSEDLVSPSTRNLIKGVGGRENLTSFLARVSYLSPRRGVVGRWVLPPARSPSICCPSLSCVLIARPRSRFAWVGRSRTTTLGVH